MQHDNKRRHLLKLSVVSAGGVRTTGEFCIIKDKATIKRLQEQGKRNNTNADRFAISAPKQKQPSANPAANPTAAAAAMASLAESGLASEPMQVEPAQSAAGDQSEAAASPTARSSKQSARPWRQPR